MYTPGLSGNNFNFSCIMSIYAASLGYSGLAGRKDWGAPKAGAGNRETGNAWRAHPATGLA